MICVFAGFDCEITNLFLKTFQEFKKKIKNVLEVKCYHMITD